MAFDGPTAPCSPPSATGNQSPAYPDVHRTGSSACIHAGKGREAGAEAGLPTSSISFGVANTALSASAAAWLTTPIDVIKTRLQVRMADGWRLADEWWLP